MLFYSITSVTGLLSQMIIRRNRQFKTARRISCVVLITLGVLFVTSELGAEEIKLRDDAPKAMSPEESVKHFQVPDDVEVKLVASEPLLSDPTSICWDEQGRLFVSEIHGYNLEGHLDIQELNKSGKLDQVVRRIQASDAAKEEAEKETFGTIRMLLDTDGDGVMDQSTVWADRLPPCHGLIAARGGIIAVGRPSIIYLADRDGDGQAEVQETLYTGFEITILERSINNPRWGLDNWIYVSSGNKGGQVTGPHLSKTATMGATDFRFKADGTAIEAVTGRNYMFGQAINDWGDRFVTPPGLYAIPIEQRYMARNPYLPSPGVNANAAHDMRLYPTSTPHPWRVERAEQKEWSKFYAERYGASEAASNGFFTSACGQMIYRADWLPEHYHGNQFACDPAQNLIHRLLLSRNGLRFSADRAADEQKSEFLTSTDQWFRPTNLATGPDGAMHIVDMCREIIEDYSAIPRYLQQQYGLIEGRRHGRIWRVVPKGKDEKPMTIPATADSSQLVELLSHKNAWQRLTAQRLLVEAADHGVVPSLVDLAVNGKTPQSRIHALHTLDGLGAMNAAALTRTLNDNHYAVRVHALQLAEPFLSSQAEILAAAIHCVEDSDAKVRLQAALSLGEVGSADVSEALAKLAGRDGADSWFQAAILSSVPNTAVELLTTIVRSTTAATNESETAQQLLRPLSAMTGARHKATEITTLLQTIASNLAGRSEQQTECLTGLLEGLQRGQVRKMTDRSSQESLRSLIAAKSPQVRKLALNISGVTGFSESPEMMSLFKNAAEEALDETQLLSDRMTAAELLGSAPGDIAMPVLEELLDSRHPAALQLAAISAVGNKADEGITGVLLSNWNGATPTVRQTILNAIFSRVDRLPGLLKAIEDKTVAPQSLSGVQRAQLLEHSDESLRTRAATLLAESMPTLDPEMTAKYQAALGNSRDAVHGEVVFKKICATCHTVNSQQKLVGPDLSVIQTRTDETVLLDILQPSAKITAGYGSYVVVDTNGRSYTGVLSSETATSVTLKSAPPASSTASVSEPQVLEQVILRRDIDEMSASSLSLMPDKLDKQLSPQDVADVLAYIRATLTTKPQNRLTLFEDDLDFLGLLKHGPGQVQPELQQPFSGTAAFRISPPQRHSPVIPGWGFRIRENPTTGEFRYLRLAWKTEEGKGVLVELADSGNWPSASDPGRRYYSGTNTTTWQANQVSATTPTEWTVVTCDLWKNGGDFTLTGIAPTAMGGDAMFDQLELLRSLDGN